MSPSLSRVCMRAHDLWSDVVTALRRRLYLPGGIGSSGGSSARIMGELPRRRDDMCRPATPPSILWLLKQTQRP